MKRSFLVPLSLLMSINSLAQTKLSSGTRLFFSDVNQNLAKNKSYISKDLCDKYPIYKLNENYYVSCLALVNNKFSSSKISETGIIIGSHTGKIATLRVPIQDFITIKFIPGIDYIEIAGKIKPTLDRAVKDTRVDSVWKGIGLPQPFTGKNVLIGITDWGFDYTNPMFYDTTLSQTRIVRAWDQYRNSGPPPTGFTYGTEISGQTNLLAAQCDTFNIYEWATHGSHVAGICAGSGAGTVYRGIAYEAEYLLATFLVDAAAVIDAYNWMYSYAQSVNKRLVINQSWGLFWIGNLDGTSLLSQAIDNLSAQGVVFVSSAGNNGDVNFHLKHAFSSLTDTLKTVIGFDNYSYYSNMWGQSVTMWGTPGYSFDIRLQILDNSNAIISNSPIYSTNSSAGYSEGHIVIGTDTIFYNLTSDSSNLLNGRPHIRLRVRNLNTGIYKIGLFINSTGGTLNCWNLIELTNDVGNWGSPFNAPNTGWINGDYYCGIGEPACTKSVVSVAAHLAETKLANGNIIGGTIAPFSSYGPTYDGRLKPDISAPGQNICSSVSSFTNQNLSGMITSVDFNGRNYKFYKFSGTSMSSPMVVGIVALMLQANPNLTPVQIKEIIKLTAREDIRTGDIPDTGSYRWGWGKINAWKAIKMALTSRQEEKYYTDLIIYPNPSSDKIYFINEPDEIPLVVSVFDLLGNRLIDNTVIHQNQLNIEELKPGIFIIEIMSGQRRILQKLIKQ